MTDKMIEVPRELLEELRDSACWSADCVRKNDCGEDSAEMHYRMLAIACDKLLRAPAKEAVTPASHTDNEGEPLPSNPDDTCPHCGSHPGDLTVAWMDGAHCATKKAQSKLDDLEAMRRDAERYRFFRDNQNLDVDSIVGMAGYLWDQMLDAAIAAEKREG